MQQECLKIMLWNSKSLSKNKPSLYNFLSSFPQDIVVLCETWLKRDFVISTPGFIAQHICRVDGYGGLSVLVKRSCPVQWVRTVDFGIPSVHFSIFKCFHLTVIAGYIPPQAQLNQQQWRSLVSDITGPFIIVGDFNALHPVFGSSSANHSGVILNRLVDELGLAVMNDGRPTFFAHSGRRANVLDLVICCPDLAHNIRCRTFDDTLGSDHFPVLSEIMFAGGGHPMLRIPRTRPNYRKCDREKYREHITESFSAGRIDEYVDFVNSIREAADYSAPNKVFRRTERLRWCPWWNQQCDRLIKLRKFTLRQYQQNPTQVTYLIAKRHIALTKKILLQKKKEAFRDFCKNLSRDSSLSEVWRRVRSFGGHEPALRIPEQRQWLPDFLAQFSPPFVRTKRQMEAVVIGDENNILCDTVSEQEIIHAIEMTNDSCPGSDEISFLLLKWLPEVGIKYLHSLYNSILDGHDIPTEWRRVVIVPIPKPGRNHATMEGYRPISLLNCNRKILERIILDRMEWWLEKNNKFDPYQFGFRKKRGTAQCLFILIGEIQDGFLSGCVTVGVFIDIKGAYDNVDIPTLLHLVRAKGIPLKIVAALQQLFAVKTITIQNDTENVGSRESYKGIPQGSPLSPLLFNVYMSTLNETLRDTGVRAVIYADDVVMLARAPTVEAAVRNVNRAMCKLSNFLSYRGLTLGSDKSKAVIFSRRRKPETTPDIRYENYTINVVSSVRYLGVHINNKLSWNLHVNELCQSAERAMNIIRSLSSVRWGCCPRLLILLHRALIRSRLEYGTWLLSPLPLSLMNKMRKVQYQGIRYALGAMRSSPTNAMLVEAAELPIHLRLQLLCKKFIIKNHALRPDPVATLILKLHASIERRGTPESRIPLIVSCYRQIAGKIALMRRIKTHDVFSQSYDCRKHCPTVITDFGWEGSHRSDFRNLPNMEFHFREWSRVHWPEATFIFTDGSVKEAQGVCSFGVYVPAIAVEVSGRLREGTSIFVTELFAIWWALNLVLQRFIQKVVIFSDSLSALKAIQHSHRNKGGDHYLVHKIRGMLWVCSARDYNVQLSWVPGHCGIRGNETADLLAETGNTSTLYIHAKDPSEILGWLKRDVLISWQMDWNHSGKTKGRRVQLIKPNVTTPPWFHQGQFESKLFTTTMTRLRMGHGLFPQHMHRIGLTESPACNCGEVGSLDHIFFNCPNFEHIRVEFLRILRKLGYQAPFNLVSLLATNSLKVYRILFQFICKCDYYI